MKLAATTLNTNLDDESGIDPEREYQSLLNSLKRKRGFGFTFVRCSPAEGEELIGRILEDIPSFSIELLRLDHPVHDFCQVVQDLPLTDSLNILFVTGIETFLVNASSIEAEPSQPESVPRSLSHLSVQLEQLEQSFPNIRFIFLIPLYALKYFIQQTPDLLDWQSDVFEFPTEMELQQEDSLRVLLEENYQKYLQLSPAERQQKLAEIQHQIESGQIEIEAKAEMLLEQGGLLALEGSYAQALANCSLAVALRPDFYLAWYNRGFTQSILGLYEEAIASYDTALAIQSDFYPALYNCGVSLSILGRYEEAISNYQLALQFKPDYYHAFIGIGTAQADLCHYEEAVLNYDRALALKPDDHHTWYCHGFALSSLRRYEQSIESYDKALELKPDDAHIWYSRGRALAELNQYEAAIESFNKSLDIQPYDYYSWNNRGLAFSNLARYTEALTSFDQALLIKPDDHYAWYCRGNVLGELGRIEEAIASYEKAIEIEPKEQAIESRQLALYRLEYS